VGGRWRAAVVALGVLGLVAVAAVALAGAGVAQRLVDQSEVSAGPAAVEPLAPESTDDSGLRSLPLFPGGSALTADQLADPQAVESAIVALAAELGLASVTDQLLRASFPSTANATYPYRYEPMASKVYATLDADVVRESPDRVVQLSSLLLVRGALARREAEWPGSPGSWGAAGAYAVLDAARAYDLSCDLHTNLAFVVSLGLLAKPSVVELETGTARRLCAADDPTPAWIQATHLSRASFVGPDERNFGLPPSRVRQLARSSYGDIQSSHPELPTGYVGEADTLLDWAEEAESLRSAPFQARTWRHEALALYETARSVSPDDGLLAGHARALSGLERHDEAVELVEAAVTRRPADAALRVLRAEVLSAAGRHAQAAEAIAEEAGAVESTWWMRHSSSFGPGFLDSRYALAALPPAEVFDATYSGLGGASVDDFDFVPVSRFLPYDQGCRWGVLLAELVLAGDRGQLSKVLVDRPRVARFDCAGWVRSYWSQVLTGVAALELGDEATFSAAVRGLGEGAEEELWDRWQDLLRRHGELDRALAAASAWVEHQPRSPRALQRLGEVHLLRGESSAAVPPLTTAAEILVAAAKTVRPEPFLDTTSPTPASEAAVVTLQLALAHEQVGESAEAKAGYRAALDLLPERPQRRPDLFGANYYETKARMHAHDRLGSLAMGEQNWDTAADAFSSAVEAGAAFPALVSWGTDVENPEFEEMLGGMLRGAQENNLALALARSGRHEAATEAAEAAVARDPASPVFLDTAAFTHQLSGDTASAAEMYERAIEADPSSYVSLNNLAVLRANEGHTEEADRLIRRALAAEPQYAMGWHNAGALWAQTWSPRQLLASQGAAGRAARLDPDLREQIPGLRMDREVYDAGLDVSRPLRADWSYVSTASEPRDRVTWTLVLLVALRLLWALGLDVLSGRLWERAVRKRGRPGRLSFLWTPTRPAWGLSLSAILLWLTFRGEVVGPVHILIAAGLAGILMGPLAVRSFVARPDRLRVGHHSWPPAMLASLVGAPFGLVFAPFPNLAEEQVEPRRLVWAAPAAVGALAVLFGVLSAATGVPVAGVLAGAALVLTASVMTPVPPLDGARLDNRRVGLAVTALLALGTVASAMAWI
jgi:cellulose synthase operon protein C